MSLKGMTFILERVCSTKLLNIARVIPDSEWILMFQDFQKSRQETYSPESIVNFKIEFMAIMFARALGL